MGHNIDITFYKNLPKHELLSISFNKYSIKTTVTSASVVKRWLSATEFIHRRRLNTLVVGLSVQWKPFSAPYRSRAAATLQLCVGRRCIIFQIIHADYIPQHLKDFLQNPYYTFVGVCNSLDVSMLTKYGLEVNPIDIRFIVAQKYDLRFRSMPMARMASEILGIKGVEKFNWVGKGNWDAYTLSLEQIKFATLDAFVSFLLGKHFKAWEDCFEIGDSSY